MNVGVERIHEHVTTIVQHRHELDTGNHAKAGSVLGTSLPIVAPRDLASASEHVRLILAILRKGKTTLAATLTLLGRSSSSE